MFLIVVTLVGTYYIRVNIVEKERYFKFMSAVGIAAASLFYQYILYLKGTVVNGFIPGLRLSTPIQHD
jgi:hypothetical protein